MFISRKKYNKIQEDLRKAIEGEKSLLKENIELKELIDKEKEKNINKVLKKCGYQYAILVKNYTDVKLYNDGRFEKRVRGIDFSSRGGNIPQLTIEK